MWDIGNRGIIVLISVLSGCVLLYNLWGPFVALTTALILVTYACYSLLVNDSILSPHALLAFEYLIEVARELNENLKNAARHILKNLREYSKNIKTLYQSRIISKMSSQRRSTYQLSNDSSSEPKNSRFNLTGQLSPIPRMNYCDMDNGIENNFYVNTHNRSYAESSVNKHTSTPLVSWRKDSPRNGGVGFFTPSRSSRQKNLPIQSHNHTLFRGEDTVFSPNGSPWGTSISPKMEQNTNVVKTVQTVAGPLLASTRFNIDPKIYSDVTSPGLSTRLTKYAMEANSKLAHQSQYGPGQFPKVNLNSSPVPLINTKSPKHKTPVTVRIAPPDVTKYSPPERQKILSDAYHVESKPSPSVVQVLRDISLKRHASREDISDLIKKQRTESMFKDNLENLEELTQKRTRDDSSKSEDDVSPQNKSLRPSKRTKTPSCYDVLNSLSSSIHTSSGVKRKAMDISRSGTPDFEKHFKPSETVQKSTLPILPQIQTNTAKLQNRDYIHKCLPSTDIINLHKNLEEQQQTQGVLKGSCGREIAPNQGLQTVVETHSGTSDVEKAESITRKNAEQVNKPVSLTDKLFMRPEPEKNEKLKSLIQEQGRIKAKFTSEDAEEIKKEDIMNMRQTSMRARLQSMFDAISGKAANKINPDVVIQAEEINTTTTTVATSALTTATTSTPSAAHAPTPAVLASLNSSTSTTNVNTSPIATSAIAPAVLKSQPKSVKHVTFSLPSTEFSQGSVNPPTVVAPPVAMVEKPLTKLEESKLQTTAAATAPAPIHTTSSAILNFTASTGNTTGPSFNFNAASSSTTPASSNAASKFGTSSATYINSLASTAISSATVSSSVFGTSNIAPSPTVIPSSSVSTTINSREASTAGNTIQLPTVTNTSQATPMFDYGAKTMSNVMKTNSQHKTPISSNTILFGGTPNAGSSVSSFGSITATTTQNPPAFGSNNTTAQSAPAFGTASSTPQNARPFENTFTHPSSTPAFGNTSIAESVPTCKGTPANTQSASTFVNTSVTSGFAFPSSSTAPAAAVPSFGNTANTTSSGFGISTTTASFTFGQPSATTTTHSGFPFGTGTTSTAAPSSSTSAIFGSAMTNATPAFRMPPTTSSPSFGIVPAPPVLGSATSSSLFGTGNTQPAYASTSNAFSTLKTTAVPAFGSTTSAPTFGTAATTATSPFSAGNTNSNTNSNATTTPTPSFSSSTGIFGQIKSPSAFGAPTPVFGNTTSPPFNSRLPFIAAFGATSSTTTTVPPTFGTTNSTAPAFGVQSPGTSALGSQTSTTLPFGSTNSVFGTSTATPPAFGTNINTTAAFGQTTSTAFGTQNTTSPVFGTTNNNVPGFGGNVASPFGSQTTTSAFGNSTSSTPTFGAAANTNTPSGAFSFGGNQNPPQQNSSFSFGGPSTTSNSASGSAPFQFGAANTKPAGFNFNSPSSTPVTNFDASATPSFSAPTPGANAFSTPNAGGMFNIGAGSTAPRSRSSRQRRQR